MPIRTNISVTEMVSSNVTVNDAAPVLVAPANPLRVKLVVQLDCDAVNVCVFVKESNDTALEGELLIKDFDSNQNLYVPRLEFTSGAIVRHAVYGIVDPTASTASSEILHVVEYIG